MISVIIPAKNSSKYIKETIDSVKLQNIKDVEIIVACDNCSDNTEEIAKSLGCKVLSVNFSSPLKTRNAGIKIAKGEYILFLDSDDVMTEDSINTLYNELIKDKDCYVVCGMAKEFISKDLTDLDKSKLKVRQEQYFGILSGTGIIKKEVFDIVGVFDETLKSGEFIEFQLRLEKNNIKIKKLPILILNRRLHNDNFGRKNKKQEYKDYISILRNKLNKK